MAVRWPTRINSKALGLNLDSKKHSNSNSHNNYNNSNISSHSNLGLDTNINPTNNNTMAATAFNGNNSTGSNNSSGAVMLRWETPTIRGRWSTFSSASLGTTVVGPVVRVIPTVASDLGLG